jgi:hypothetical protein
MLQNSTNVKEKTRHGLLTTWLVLIIIFNIIAIIIAMPKGSPSVQDLPWWQALITIVFNLFNIVCAIALFFWKKWGFWGFCAGSVAAFIANIIMGELVILALVDMVIGLAVLYLVLNIGKDNKGWPQLE